MAYVIAYNVTLPFLNQTFEMIYFIIHLFVNGEDFDENMFQGGEKKDDYG